MFNELLVFLGYTVIAASALASGVGVVFYLDYLLGASVRVRTQHFAALCFLATAVTAICAIKIAWFPAVPELRLHIETNLSGNQLSGEPIRPTISSFDESSCYTSGSYFVCGNSIKNK